MEMRTTNFERIRRRWTMRKDVCYINNASYATNFETIRRRLTMRKDVRYINNASYATNFERIRRRWTMRATQWILKGYAGDGNTRYCKPKPKRTAVHIEQTAPLDPSHRFCPSLMENANNEFWKDTPAVNNAQRRLLRKQRELRNEFWKDTQAVNNLYLYLLFALSFSNVL